jgi:hypothetical protein
MKRNTITATVEIPALRIPRLSMTIRGVMLAMIPIALWLGLRVHVQRWDARRIVMYQQRDVTRSIMAEVGEDFVAAGPPAERRWRSVDRATSRSRWTERLDAWESRGGKDVPLIRARVSGANGEFAIRPIIVETYGAPPDAPWLDRLLRAYRARGWRYETVVRPSR